MVEMHSAFPLLQYRSHVVGRGHIAVQRFLTVSHWVWSSASQPSLGVTARPEQAMQAYRFRWSPSIWIYLDLGHDTRRPSGSPAWCWTGPADQCFCPALPTSGGPSDHGAVGIEARDFQLDDLLQRLVLLQALHVLRVVKLPTFLA